MAPHAEKLKLLRVVVREDFSLQRARKFLTDLLDTIKILDQAPASVHAFHREAHRQQTMLQMERSVRHTDVDDGHSLQGKTGKTHGLC